jgi:DNA primase
MSMDQVEEVRAAAPVEEIIGEFVPLKRSGRSWVGKCPFHEDSTPSFSVVPGKGYHCFGCDASGDVFSFLMQFKGMDFPEALRWLAARVGIVLRESRGPLGEEDPFRPFYEANGFAAAFYREKLLDDAEGKGAREYLEGRGITPEVAEAFQLGFAPDSWRELRDAAVRHGFDDVLLEKVGLITRSEKSPEPYDRFRGRIVFPIEALGGKIIAFGGRLIPGAAQGPGGGGPKYLNSPETPVYHKGEHLYGLHRARNAIRSAEVVLVVEGYMDLVALHAAGFQQTVATLGTATTPEQGKLLARFTRRALLLFDSDPAGMKATFRAADVLLAEGIHPSVVTLPTGEDPDTLVRSAGPAALQQYLDGAVDVLDRKLQMMDERGYFASIEGTRKALDRLLPTVRAAKDPAIRDLYVARIASRTGIRRETVEGELGGEAGVSASARGRASVDAGQRAAARRAAALPLPTLGAERELLRLLVRDRDWIERAMERIGPDDFTDPVFRTIFLALVENPELNQVPIGMDPGVGRRLEDLLADPAELAHPSEVFEAAVGRMLEVGVALRLEELDRRIHEARSYEEQVSLWEEKRRLTREGRSGRVDWREAARRFADRRYNRQAPGE